MKQIFIIFSFVCLLNLTAICQEKMNGGNSIMTNDAYNFISINEIMMWISNNGDGSHDPRTDGGGLYWPGGVNGTISAVFEDGLLWGGKIGSEIRVNGNTHRQGLQAGKILPDGTPDDPSRPKYRVYKILDGWENLPPGPLRDQYEQDYNEWPVEDGAPWVDVDGDGIFTPGVDTPQYVGDETLWYVANDMDTLRSTFTYGSLPIGLEFQTTTYGFDETNFLKDAVFKKYKIINKSQDVVEDMYLSYWEDDDLGNANDDFSGCDTVLNLGYVYNGDNNDEGYYETPPPAVGHMLVQGPIVPGLPGDSAYFDNEWRKGFKNLPMTTFAFYINGNPTYRDPQQGVYQGTIEFYNYMQGFLWDGSPYIDPNTGIITTFPLSGFPVNSTGWYEGAGWPGGPIPGDRRSLITSGPFNLAPGDTQEVVIVIFLAQGTDNINSITELRVKAQQIHDYHQSSLIFAATSLNMGTPSGSQILEVSSIEGFSIGDYIRINPGGYNEETNTITGFGSILLQTPLQFDHFVGETIVNLIPTSLEENNTFIPNKHTLSQNYPNPFNPTTTIKYSIPKLSFVTIKIYDVLGSEITTLVYEEKPAGSYQIEFDATELSSGIYFYRLQAVPTGRQAGDFVETKKMVLLR